MRPVAPDLTPPGAASWRAAVRAGTAPPAPALLERLQLALGATARLRQYDAYLPVPLSGPSRTVYEYRTVAATTRPKPTSGLVVYDLRTCAQAIDSGPKKRRATRKPKEESA